MGLASDLTQAECDLAERADLGRVLDAALARLGRGRLEVSCRLATQGELRRLNREFAHLDATTDVLAFPAAASRDPDFRMPPAEPGFLGDIVISVRTAISQARVVGRSAEDELRLLAVHGLLHLVGHDHRCPPEAREMAGATQWLLEGDAQDRGAPAPADLPPLTSG
ncbi:MAG: rRNA maturation RNase YbeY [Candidatus Dormibacteria bacterium]